MMPTDIVSGLEFPEGPVWCSDDSILLVEIHRGTVSRVAGGETSVVSQCGYGPNGIAVGPDGHLYVCNNGGFEWTRHKDYFIPGGQPADYPGGSIQRVDPQSGECEVVFREVEGRSLKGPNDIVFDETGGYWFTDLGKTREHDRDLGALYYVSSSGETSEAVFPVEGGPNGVGLSPDGSRVYVAETYTGRVHFWELDGPGQIRRNLKSVHGGYYLATADNGAALDSLAVDSEGNVCVATVGRGGGITIFSPDGTQRLVPTGDPMTTNICFGGADLRTAYLTLSWTGRLAEIEWETPGLKLPFNL